MLPGKKYKPEDFIAIAWARRWFVIIPFLLVGTGAVVYAQIQPNRYRSATQIQVVPQQVPTNYVQSTVTTLLSDRLNMISQDHPQPHPPRADRGRIRSVSARAQDDDHAGRDRADAEGHRRDDRAEPEPAGRQRRLRRQLPVREPQDRTRGDGAARLRSSSARTRQTAQVMADATNQFLEAQLEEARRKLVDHETRLKEFREKNAGSLPSQVPSNLQAIQTMQIQLQNMADETSRDRDRRLIVERGLADTAQQPVVEAAGDPAAAAADAPVAERLAAARRVLAAMEVRLKPEHPDVVRMKHTIRDLEKQADAEALGQPVSAGSTATRPMTPAERLRQTKMATAQAEIQVIDRRIAERQTEEQQLRAKLAGYQSRLEESPARETELTELMRDYDTLKTTYTDLLKKSQSSKLALNLEQRQIGEQFRIVDGARLAERPFSPNRPRIIIMGAVAGLGLGLGLVALLEYRDATYKTDDDVVMALALPVLAMIPAMVTRAEERASTRRRRLLGVTVMASVLVAAGLVVWKLRLLRRGCDASVDVMYESFFELRERPFDLTPNPRFLLLTSRHREALSNLHYGVTRQKGVTLLLGEAGTGKTTLIRAALQQWELSGHRIAYVNNPTLTRAEFLESVAQALDLGAENAGSKVRFLTALTSLVMERHAQGLVTGLLIDEAQCLSDELLEEVRLLANIETPAEKVFPVVLAGQPELAARLNEPGLRQLKQRVALRCRLEPLDVREVAAYVSGRIRLAGGVSRALFTREAVMAIHEYWGDPPRHQRDLRQRAAVGVRDQSESGAAVARRGSLPRFRHFASAGRRRATIPVPRWPTRNLRRGSRRRPGRPRRRRRRRATP